ncbi:MAG: SAM hydrolase/SAM-dependent halogenase family protein [Candidatus Longimicrobiales bacterium M2_2A_002]
MTRITLLTDFGTVDGYAAAMAGVVAATAPEAVVEHASHDVAQGDVFAAALALSRYAPLYPEGSVHVAVVDPGVGTARRPLAARVDGRFYVAPDNGVLSLVLQGAERVRMVEIMDPDIVNGASATFHGRDIFAPAAGRLARRDALEELGPPVHDPVLLPMPQPARTDSGVRGEVLLADRFGNLVTNIPADWISESSRVRVGSESVGPVRRTYGDVGAGEVLALIGSVGLLEISVRDGSAAARLGTDRGAEVVVEQS